MGGEAQMPPPKPVSRILFKQDAYLSTSIYTTATKLEDTIQMPRVKDPETLGKLFALLLSSIWPKWSSTKTTEALPLNRKKSLKKSHSNRFESQISKRSTKRLKKAGFVSLKLGLKPAVL